MEVPASQNPASPQMEKEWRDKSDKVIFKAKLMEFEDGKVHLRRSDNGEMVIMPLADLNEFHQEEIKFFAED